MENTSVILAYKAVNHHRGPIHTHANLTAADYEKASLSEAFLPEQLWRSRPT